MTRARFVALAFRGDEARYRRFVGLLRSVVPPAAGVILRGSGVTGRRWSDGKPFDADGPGTSDLDITFIGGGMARDWERFYLPRIHSVPLSDEHPDACPRFVALRRTLCAIARRPVNLQATVATLQRLRALFMRQPSLVLVEPVARPARCARRARSARRARMPRVVRGVGDRHQSAGVRESS